MTKKPPLDVVRHERTRLYAARQYIDTDLEERLKLRLRFDVYFQDPEFAAKHPDLAFDDDFFVPWEPGLGDGPTSARFAVVDYNGDTESLAPPAKWNADVDAFVDHAGKPLTRASVDSLQFHQLHVWALVQRALDFFESGFGLGRSIDWGFDGNRLIVVPHAGYGQNAYYDRKSKSLQFYYFDEKGARVQTCLSADIVNHEFGHAVLDGIRPYFIEAVAPETAAFHEFMGDLTAILIAFRNKKFRHFLGTESNGNLSSQTALSNIAEQFGKAVSDREYLRSALDPVKMTDLDARDRQRPHRLSQVLTGAMFDIIRALSRYYIDKKNNSVDMAFWRTIQRMQSMAVQPLDLLPPVDVTFKDYALAMLRAENIANPTDPEGYCRIMSGVFVDRGILTDADRAKLDTPRPLFSRLDLSVFHDVDRLSSSRAEAYRFLDDNRESLFIPRTADLVVAGLHTAQKLTREARRLPKQILLQYLWREDVALDGVEFGRFGGQRASMLCGATLALDQNGNVVSWMRKPGSVPVGRGKDSEAEAVEGAQRRKAFLSDVAARVAAGRIGDVVGSEKGLLAGRIAPLTARDVDGAVRFELAPHFAIHDDHENELGSREWQISS